MILEVFCNLDNSVIYDPICCYVCYVTFDTSAEYQDLVLAVNLNGKGIYLLLKSVSCSRVPSSEILQGD